MEDVKLAFEQFLSWDPAGVRRYAEQLLDQADDDTAFFGSSNLTRGVLCAFSEVSDTSNIVFVAQDALADSSYVAYLRQLYAGRFRLPSDAEIEAAAACGEADSAERLSRMVFEKNKHMNLTNLLQCLKVSPLLLDTKSEVMLKLRME